MSKDPREVEKTDRNSSCPCTKAEILEWFKGRNSENHVQLIVECGAFEDYPTLWNEVLDICLHNKASDNMWITPKGKIYSCGFANHARVAKLMGLSEVNLEDAGWVKVSSRTAYGTVRPTSRQARILNDGGYKISNYLMNNSMKTTTRKPQEIWE